MTEEVKRVLSMLHSNKSKEIQKKGIKKALEIEDIGIFFDIKFFGNFLYFENCAHVISTKTDIELEPYISEMMEWIEDLNIPGAITILDRLNRMQGERLKDYFLKRVREAIILDNDEGLRMLDILSNLLPNHSLAIELSESEKTILEKHYEEPGWWDFYSEDDLKENLANLYELKKDDRFKMTQIDKTIEFYTEMLADIQKNREGNTIDTNNVNGQ